MAVRAPENARVLYESLRNSSVSSDSGIVLLQPYQEHLLPDYHDAENARPYHPSISPYVNSRPYVDARNENILPASNVTVNSNTNDKRMFSWVLSKLARHPWTESTEFTELWSDIPNTAARHKEQKASDGGKASTENVVSSSNYDSSRISLTLRNYPWTASTEFVVLWTDIPSELDTIQNLSDDGKWSMNQNGMDSSSNIPLATHVSDRKQDPAATSGIFNFGAKSEKLTKLSRNPPNNSISNGINSKCSKQKKAECCGQFSDCRCNIQRAAMNWRYHIILLTMKNSVISYTYFCHLYGRSPYRHMSGE
ncbi:hypothetical protein HNY73_006627 [Argiope bruennichi]|uniref:Uncharacterized protein n=1 Tax=Argiope bruennichi TaxID=94029 RepID=A0A8T0FGL3_ARGBR|nr:hypothetical protein HNY73_006627 [Argiope bruennichi]